MGERLAKALSVCAKGRKKQLPEMSSSVHKARTAPVAALVLRMLDVFPHFAWRLISLVLKAQLAVPAYEYVPINVSHKGLGRADKLRALHPARERFDLVDYSRTDTCSTLGWIDNDLADGNDHSFGHDLQRDERYVQASSCRQEMTGNR